MRSTKTMIVLAVCVAFFIGGCAGPNVKSRWRDRDIVIDGTDSEWQDCQTHYDKEHRMVIGIVNDDSHLYIRITSSDRKLQQQILGMGMTIWFDPTCDKEKTFGIRFPIGMAGGMKPPGDEESSYPDHPRGEMFPDRKPSEMPRTGNMPGNVGKEIEFVSSGHSEQIGTDELDSYGVNLEIQLLKGVFTYELSVPLLPSKATPYAVGKTETGRIQVGIVTETPEMDMRNDRQRPVGRMGFDDGIMGPSGRGPMETGDDMRGPGGIGGGRPPGGRDFPGKKSESLELWLTVDLARCCPE